MLCFEMAETSTCLSVCNAATSVCELDGNLLPVELYIVDKKGL